MRFIYYFDNALKVLSFYSVYAGKKKKPSQLAKATISDPSAAFLIPFGCGQRVELAYYLCTV